MKAQDLTLWTIGHSTKSSEDLIALLRTYRVEALADVRRFPGSRRFPHFNAEVLAASLMSVGIEYHHFAELGGRRKPRPNSANTAWRNEAFRGYADHMETSEFGVGMERLLELAQRKRTALMCAEAVWWQCHRALISDYLKAGGHTVLHILSATKIEEHPSFICGFPSSLSTSTAEFRLTAISRIKGFTEF
jgi:uncharacterized protein (DUF488 family)